MADLTFHIDDRFSRELPADPKTNNNRRQVKGACFSYVEPRIPSNPSLLHVAKETAELVGLSEASLSTKEFLAVFSGGAVMAGTKPYAMNYGGHQFGHWAGQLGDGRAINLAEVVHADKHWTLQLKGAGETPYSRSADGLAVLRSSIREHLCSEAMYHLGVPTSRSLSLCLTGDQVLRDIMYDGNAAYEKGAVVCRVAQSFIRFGSFEIHAANRDEATLKALADHTIKHHFPEITATGKDKYGTFFKAVCQRSLDLVIHWQRVGFVHGVMNTDNMSILGDTIDYGPYGWLEGYEADWTPNTTDRHGKRYRYGNQPDMVFWNLHKLANALYVLVGEADPFVAGLEAFRQNFTSDYLQMMRDKLGLQEKRAEDQQLVDELQRVLQLIETDMTIFFRTLADFSATSPLKGQLGDLEFCKTAFYSVPELTGEVLAAWLGWLQSYQQRLSLEKRNQQERKAAMNAVNPKYVLRNYMAQLAIDAADQGDYTLLDELHQLLKSPYTEQPDHERWFAKRPEWARHKVGCSMLSCSS